MSNYASTGPLRTRASFNAAHGSVPWLPWAAALVPPLRAGMRVLDAGCGPGWLWDAVAPPEGVDLTLLDRSEAMVAAATERLARLSPAGVVASLDALPDLGAPFDVATCTHVLYHVDDPGEALDALARVLAPGGTLVVTTICDDDLPEVNALTRDAYGHDPVAPLHVRFGADVAEALIRARFAAVARHDFHDFYAIRDADLLAGHVLSIPPGPDLSATERERVRALAAERIAAAGGTLRSDRRQALFTARPN